MVATRAEVQPGPNGVNRVVYVREERERLHDELTALRNDVDRVAAEADVLRVRCKQYIRELRKDARVHGVRPPTPPKPPPSVTGPMLLRARTLAGRSQRELAGEFGHSRSALAEAERGRRPVPELLGKWARQVLRISGELEEAS